MYINKKIPVFSTYGDLIRFISSKVSLTLTIDLYMLIPFHCAISKLHPPISESITKLGVCEIVAVMTFASERNASRLITVHCHPSSPNRMIQFPK